MPDRGLGLDSLRDLGAGLSRASERWVPDAWVICMALTAVALGLSILGAGAASIPRVPGRGPVAYL